jgi:Formin Homology 2 Domain
VLLFSPRLQITGTIWDKKASEDHVSIDEKELETLFAVNKPAPAAAAGAPKSPRAGATKKKVTTVLDFQRSNNVNILLHRFSGKSPDDIKKAIINLDYEVLTTDNVKALLNTAPTDDEMAMIKGVADDPV